MTPSEFLSQLDEPRRANLSAIYDAIIETDKNVEPSVELIMGKRMIVYKEDGIFVYGLASPKGYMSLHLMPI